MLFNFEIENQTARHIAGNKPDRIGLAVVVFFLVLTVLTLILYLHTAFSLLGAVLVSLILVSFCAVPFVAWKVRRKKAEAAKLEKVRAEQLDAHRSQIDANL